MLLMGKFSKQLDSDSVQSCILFGPYLGMGALDLMGAIIASDEDCVIENHFDSVQGSSLSARAFVFLHLFSFFISVIYFLYFCHLLFFIRHCALLFSFRITFKDTICK